MRRVLSKVRLFWMFFAVGLIGGCSVMSAAAQTSCLKTTMINLNTSVNGSLDGSECTIDDLVGNQDFTYFDVYILTLVNPGTLKIAMQSTAFDTYLILFTDDVLSNLDSGYITENDDATETTTNSEIVQSLDAGNYIVIANSFDEWATGPYTLQTQFEAHCLGSFCDVPPTHWAYSFIQIFAAAGITGGCGNNNYCPDAPVTRAQMAVFLERAMRGSDYKPPGATGTMFGDIPATHWAGGYIEQFAKDKITGGCGSGNYCPDAPVTRAQMAVFLEKAMHWPEPFSPPPPTGVFADVPVTNSFAGWIEQLAADKITGGCGSGNYCPNAPVTRAQMAVFLVRAFGL